VRDLLRYICRVMQQVDCVPYHSLNMSEFPQFQFRCAHVWFRFMRLSHS
jgi:hypothetical protein